MSTNTQGTHGNDFNYDQSKRAEYVLAHVLKDEIKDAAQIEEVIGRSWRAVPVSSEKNAAPIVNDTTSKRMMSRMLFITQDTDYLDPNSIAMNVMYKLAILFDEVHVMVLLPLRAQKKTKRLADNFWLYRAEAQYWWHLPKRALMRAEEELNFSDGFRPDFIVASDPFESGHAAKLIAETYDRPYQVHVKNDFFNKTFFPSPVTQFLKRRMAKQVIKYADSVRASTKHILKQLEEKCKISDNVALLPQYHSYKAIRQTKPDFDVHERYGAGFSAVVVAFGPFTADSHLHDTISALYPILSQNKKIGLILIGDGNGKDVLEGKVKKLKIHKNVIFLPKHIDTVSILKTADVVVVTDIRAESEDHVLSAAAAGAPMVLYETNFRLDMFSDGTSASFCKQGDTAAVGNAVESLLSNQPLRTQYKAAAEQVVETRVEEDALKYFIALRDSLELTLFADDAKEYAKAKESSTHEKN